eukprot:gnl/Chilomastix_cuspidata/219.p1 GENE.gnl/Chilomastix_cuspidata/219~~gnl/Chilomastix_cuspidata/219.p1  ORF type:complete len:340 (+),score=105.56 gnl/Chilomastix_cuspidata/219:41-1060(+)
MSTAPRSDPTYTFAELKQLFVPCELPRELQREAIQSIISIPSIFPSNHLHIKPFNCLIESSVKSPSQRIPSDLFTSFQSGISHDRTSFAHGHTLGDRAQRLSPPEAALADGAAFAQSAGRPEVAAAPEAGAGWGAHPSFFFDFLAPADGVAPLGQPRFSSRSMSLPENILAQDVPAPLPRVVSGAFWEYLGTDGRIYGAFANEQMRSWFEQGELPRNLCVRALYSGASFTPLSELFPRGDPFGPSAAGGSFFPAPHGADLSLEFSSPRSLDWHTSPSSPRTNSDAISGDHSRSRTYHTAPGDDSRPSARFTRPPESPITFRRGAINPRNSAHSGSAPFQ